MIETDLVALIKSTSNVNSYIGGSTLPRVYPLVAPQSATKPYLVYFQVASDRKYSHQGYSTLQSPLFQISIYSDKYDIAKEIKKNILAMLEGWSSDRVNGVFITSENDIYEQETKLYHIPVTFKVWYKQ